MNIFVLNGHKYYPFAQGRLNKTLFDKIIELVTPDNQIKTTIVENGYDLNEEIEKFLWADIIIMQTPINWFSFPGMFKSYIDDVYKHGSFYGASEEYGKGGLLKNKKYMYSLTWNSPCYAFSEFGGFYDGRGMDEVIIYCRKEKVVKRLAKGWNVTADEVLLSRLTNYLGESSVKVIEKPIESVH